MADYRKRRGYKTQADFAIVADVQPRTIVDWETSVMIPDFGRRVLLAKLLKIPPALLGLDWRLVVFDENTGEHQ
ncbi:MAG: helix-turn-helix transcriptional regulator, partial [Ktedonobacteraceae bacterium]